MTTMLLRTPDLLHTCGDLGARLGALLEKQGMEILYGNGNGMGMETRTWKGMGTET